MKCPICDNEILAPNGQVDFCPSCQAEAPLVNRFYNMESYLAWKNKSKYSTPNAATTTVAILPEKYASQSKTEEMESSSSKKTHLVAIAFFSLLLVMAVVVLVVGMTSPSYKYNKAVELMNNGQYNEAIEAFEAMDGYKDSETQIENCQTALKDIDYNKTVELMNNGQYSEAIASFETMDGYKDSESLKSECEIQILSGLNVGDSFCYGNYNDEALEWTILDIKNNQVLAITTDAVEEMPYNDSQTDFIWPSYTLRTWLNNDFFSSAFTSEEQSRILTTTVDFGRNEQYYIYVGNANKDTEDKLFLLSIFEARKYFVDDTARKCNYKGSSCWWWLRSLGNDKSAAARIRNAGSIDYYGGNVDINIGGVRPAMWISLE